MIPNDKMDVNRLDTTLGWLVGIVALVAVGFHASMVWLPLFGGMMNQNAHLGFCLVLALLQWSKESGSLWKKAIFWLAASASLAIVIYLAVHYERLDFFAGFPEPLDAVVGVTLIVIVLAATWKSFGPIFPVLVMMAMAYTLWGHRLPGVMGHGGFEFGFIVSSLSVGFQGIFGMLLSASATMLFLLVIFGAIFEATGVTAFFMEFGKLLGRLLPGGSGHMAIFSSSFVGMVNGAAPANVAITGSYTIPVMKKAGFRPETAAGIESMASTGGQLTPPIMGIAIFVMAGFLGISYVTLMSKALIPAVAYYAVAVLGVVLIAFREKIPMVTETADRNVILNGAPLFLIPITVLTVIMFKHYSIGYAAFWAIVTLLLVSFARSRSRPRLQILVRNLIDGAFMAATFGIAIGCIGMLIKILTFTGAATKLGLVAGMVSGGNVTLLLVMIMVVSIILGASLPTVIAYIIVAFVAAPVVVEAGVPIVRAHLFVYYFAILSAVTPPIAGAAMVGCKIAGTGYIKSSWESFKLVGPFFLVPFFIINNPLLMSEPQPLVQGVMVIIALIIALVTMTCFCQGYGLVKTNWIEQTALLTSAMLATCFGMYRHTGFFAGSLLLAVWVFFHLWRKYRLSK